jgi:hypothetical protein
MSFGSTHFEVFSRKGAGASWAFFGAYGTRDQAVNAAKEVLNAGQAQAVRVYRETFNDDTGEFLSQKIFEEGSAAEKAAKQTVVLPCSKPDDFYTATGRRTISRLLRESLAGWRITATELLHHPGHLQRLELAGTVLQQAIQKWAVKHAGNTGQPVQQIIIKLNGLVADAMRRVVIDGQERKFPLFEKEKLSALLASLVDSATPDYIISGAIARHIAPARSWVEKLDCLLALMDALPEDGPARALGVKTIDTIIAELLASSAALVDLLGDQPDLGSALLHLCALLLGRAEDLNDFPSCVGALAQAFAQGQFPLARASIGERILREIRGGRRLKPHSLDDELHVMRLLASTLAAAQGTLISSEDFEDAFTDRSSHLVVPETVERYLAGLDRPGAKIERLIALAENVVGNANRRELISFVNGILGSPRTETYYVDGREPIQARLAELRALQKRLQQAPFHDSHRDRLAEAVDGLAVAAERKAGLLSGLAKVSPTPVAFAEHLLTLLAGDGVTEGKLAEAVRGRLRDCVADPGFAAALSGLDPASVQRFRRLLAAAGLEGSAKQQAAL